MARVRRDSKRLPEPPVERMHDGLMLVALIAWGIFGLLLIVYLL